MLEKLAKQQDRTLKIGQGITYRFNNFKNKKVIKYAQEVDKIEKMLWHVKLLLRPKMISDQAALSKLKTI